MASQEGRDKHPEWYWNLLANPEVTVEVHGRTHTARARQVTGEERERLWKTCVLHYPDYDIYRQRTTREIPVFQCVPVQEPTL